MVEKGGKYVPPAKRKRAAGDGSDGLAAVSAADAAVADPQRESWDRMARHFTGLVNRVNARNVADLLPSVFDENVVRGRGLLVRAVMAAQAYSNHFADVLAALAAYVNAKAPMVGELLVHRLVARFRDRADACDWAGAAPSAAFLGHLYNQGVVAPLLVLQLLHMLLEQLQPDRVLLAVDLAAVVGERLAETNAALLHGAFEVLRRALQDRASPLPPHVRYRIEQLLELRRKSFAGHPAIAAGLQVVDPLEQIEHDVALDDELQTHPELDAFRPSNRYAAQEERYAQFRREVLAQKSDAGAGTGGAAASTLAQEAKVVIQDATGANLVNLRRSLYLTIMSSLVFEESATKILRMQIPRESRIEVCRMIAECAMQERTYLRYFGLLAQRFCVLGEDYEAHFRELFREYYETVFRLESTQLRNVASLFAHMLATDALRWLVFESVDLIEEASSPSSRIFLKVIFTEVAEQIGQVRLEARLYDGSFNTARLLPTDTAAHARFAINFFTAIGLGLVTERLRAELPRLAAVEAARSPAADADDEDDYYDDEDDEEDDFDRGDNGGGDNSDGFSGRS